ncbi:MAG: hypothetical protein L3J20_13040 [Flavobacteriaceae bacterium]|nr:hypothetical protein [Flavobacteriaceae bacterium]
MKTILNNYFFLLSITVFLLSACSVEDVIKQVTDGDDFTAKVNGDDFRTNKVGINAKIDVNIDQSGIYFIAIAAADITNTNNVKGIGLLMVGSDFDQLSAGETFDKASKNDTEGGGAGYSEDLGTSDVEVDADLIESIFIKITALDKDKKLISGEFNFVVVDEDTNKKYTITDGKFTNIVYQLE